MNTSDNVLVLKELFVLMGKSVINSNQIDEDLYRMLEVVSALGGLGVSGLGEGCCLKQLGEGRPFSKNFQLMRG